MSIAMFFRAADGVLVVADGREVAVNDAGFEWRSDDARKLSSYIGPSPVIGAAVGLAALGVGDAQKDVLSVIDEVLEGERPQFGVAAGEGHWTAKAVAYVALQEAEVLLGPSGLGCSVVVARIVDWHAGSGDPTMWGFELRSVDAEEDGVIIPSTSSATTECTSFAFTGLYSVPESSVWELVRKQLDRTASFLDGEVEVDDPRWLPPFFVGSSQSLDEVSAQVEEVLSDLQRRHPDAFLECQVGGTWVFGELRPGQAPSFSTRTLGPFSPVRSSLS